MIEKPFGHDLASARELNATLEGVFPPEAVFRIDHYLGKETVQNILALRFANEMYEPIWNRGYVDHVQITMAEDIGIGGRAGYYDGIGAARDVIQNHLLQLLALMAMEEPVAFDADSLRMEKEKVLSAVRLPADLATGTARGQYSAGWQGGRQVRGFLEEDGIPADSRTETYAALRLGVDTRRWAGVPFYLRAGKRLPRRMTEIALIFQRAPHLPFSATDTEELGQNALVIRIQPDEGITVRFGSKVPGTAMEVRDVNMDFAYGESFTESSPEAYERLLLDVLIGDPPLFPRQQEVELGWRILDPVEDFWASYTKPEQYPAGFGGPGVSRRDDGTGRARMAALVGLRQEAAMTIDLTDTTTGAIHEALTQARRRMGGPASGMVLTLIIVTDESAQYDAVRAASQAGREHPSRVLAVITRRPKAESRLDAEIRVGETGPGETILLRMYGPLGQHADSVVAPLLAPDVPVVTWWPDEAPPAPRADPLGAVAQRRVTDAAASDTPQEMLLSLAKAYQPGDTDLSWTRSTPWRSLLAATLDQPYPELLSGEVLAEPDNPTADLIAAWLGHAAGHRGAARRVRRPRHHRGQLRDPGREGRDLPSGRPDGHPVLARPAGTPGRAAPPGHRRPDRRGTAQAGTRRGLRGNPARAGRQALTGERARGYRAPGCAAAGQGRGGPPGHQAGRLRGRPRHRLGGADRGRRRHRWRREPRRPTPPRWPCRMPVRFRFPPRARAAGSARYS